MWSVLRRVFVEEWLLVRAVALKVEQMKPFQPSIPTIVNVKINHA